MIATSHDPCRPYTQTRSDNHQRPLVPRVTTCLQTDDSRSLGNKWFIELGKSCSNGFECKPITKLAHGWYLVFNGITITQQGDFLRLSQLKHVINLDILTKIELYLFPVTFWRARGAHTASAAWLYVPFIFAKSSQVKSGPSTMLS